jgi:hypothetical protein
MSTIALFVRGVIINRDNELTSCDNRGRQDRWQSNCRVIHTAGREPCKRAPISSAILVISAAGGNSRASVAGRVRAGRPVGDSRRASATVLTYVPSAVRQQRLGRPESF